jgi:hypothetical protein
VTVEGRTLVVERPYSRRPRLLLGGTELPKDRFGNYLLPDENGKHRKVAVGFDYRHLAPRLEVGEHRLLTAPPLPRGAWLLLAPVVILGLMGGAVGAGLGVAAAMLSAQQLRRPGGGRVKFAVAAGIEVVAVVVYVGLVVLIDRL